MYFVIPAKIIISGVANYKSSSGYKTENRYFVLDLINPKVKLKLNRVPRLPLRFGPIGAVLQNQALICGGSKNFDDNYHRDGPDYGEPHQLILNSRNFG